MKLIERGRDLLHSIIKLFWILWRVLVWPIKTLKKSLISMVDFMFNTTISTVQKLVLLWSIFIVLALVSIILYIVFYSFYVPTAEISRPVYLSFSVCSSGVGICSFPSANVSFWNEEGTIQQFLGQGQAYSVELELETPDSHSNRDLGMFMVVIKMYDRHGHISATSQRSTMFQYRSTFLRFIDMAMFSPLYFIGLMEQKRTLAVKFFSHFIDDYYHPSVGVTVELHSHKIEFYSAKLIFLAKFTGLKYLLHNWPLMSAFCAFWFNLFILAVGVAAVLLQRRFQQFDAGATIESIRNLDVQTLDNQNMLEDDTDTKPPDEDDDDGSETFQIPLVQEPVDFPIPEESEELLLELRQRRVN